MITGSEREIYCNGHHDRRRGIPRRDAPVCLREYWLDGWDQADGELLNAALDSWHARMARIEAESKP